MALGHCRRGLGNGSQLANQFQEVEHFRCESVPLLFGIYFLLSKLNRCPQAFRWNPGLRRKSLQRKSLTPAPDDSLQITAE